MFNSSPITSWEGAAAFFTWAGTSYAEFWVVVMVILCCVPIYISLKAENVAEKKYSRRRK